jgi:hypothetical protein
VAVGSGVVKKKKQQRRVLGEQRAILMQGEGQQQQQQQQQQGSGSGSGSWSGREEADANEETTSAPARTRERREARGKGRQAEAEEEQEQEEQGTPSTSGRPSAAAKPGGERAKVPKLWGAGIVSPWLYYMGLHSTFAMHFEVRELSG